MYKKISLAIFLVALSASGSVAQSMPDLLDARNYVLNQRVKALSSGYSQHLRNKRIRQILKLLRVRCYDDHHGNGHHNNGHGNGHHDHGNGHGYGHCKHRPPSP